MYNPMSEPGNNDKTEAPPQYNQPPPPPSQYPNYGMPGQPMQHQPMPQPGFMQQQSTNNTTVVVQQQQPQQVVIQGPRNWSTDLCGCFEDCGGCLLGLFCPLIHSCVVSGKAGECCCVGCCCPIALRTKIRTRHNIAGSIVDDCCILACCHPLAMCQMDRELNIHGI
ncbi:cornifelin homolog B-like [Xenia sp. Carnegie-2017]|uniref:cornifelin homolog B-like n=1 Tax=Xenia sp. Carnegie-2017 TaxID=2897299 RepID=UPI001F0356CC|nr:cornifelin homolog B-like [Xenia sp. Carnegie-2017]